MTIPLWVMLGFAAWTLAVLFGSVGVYRWSRILSGRATVAEWHAELPQGSAWYQRAMRAHMNCVENLPVYGAVALAAALSGVGGRDLDVLAVLYLGARIAQSLVHILVVQSEAIAGIRFALYFTQMVCIVSMGVLIAMRA